MDLCYDCWGTVYVCGNFLVNHALVLESRNAGNSECLDYTIITKEETMRIRDFRGHPDYLKLTEDELRLHSEKNYDYARGGDPLGNFKRVSTIKQLYPGLDWSTPTATAIDYMLKQFDALLWQLSQHFEGEVENIDARLRDSHIYLKIARILHREGG